VLEKLEAEMELQDHEAKKRKNTRVFYVLSARNSNFDYNDDCSNEVCVTDIYVTHSLFQCI